MVTCQAAANSLNQMNSDAALRGRVMALYITAWVPHPSEHLSSAGSPRSSDHVPDWPLGAPQQSLLH